ncbi:MAG: hypothetical protein ABGX22_24680 [Pirellulaceae bacterium]
MSTRLDPVVGKKLQSFGRRRRRFIRVRGLCAGIVSFLIFMSAISFADWSWVLSDQTRWSLSILAYLSVVVVVWLTCLRRMVHSPSLDDLAARVEMAAPELRENLLSAVELATDDPKLVKDSPVFRSLLQGNVARQMGTVRINSLLPWRLLSVWLVVALLLVSTMAVVLSVPNPTFRRLVTRAMLPGANVARISRIYVKILKPTPHSLTLAENETVAVLVEISGGDVDEVTLETRTPNQGEVRQTMRRRDAAVFVANLQVADESIEYRILAGDAVTKRYLIVSRARPRVLAFHKTYHFPEYAGLEDGEVTEKHGDLRALEGTQAELILEVDQDVVGAELRLERQDSEEIQSIPLVASGERRYRVSLPIEDSSLYKVHLVSKETGFENIFSPKYEISPQPDLIPRVGFVDQKERTLLLPPNDILSLSAMAEDDLPLVRLEQQFSINGRDWQTSPLDAETGRRMTAEWQWDLLPMKLESGDQLMTRLLATDRKGNVGESVPLRIVVAAPEFDPDRHTSAIIKSRFYDALADFSDGFAKHQTDVKELLDRLRDTSRPQEAAAADLASLREVASKQHGEAGRLLERVHLVLSEMPAGVDAYELDLVGRVVGRLQHDHANTPTRLLEALKREDIDQNGIEATYKSLQTAFDRSADDAKQLAKLYRDLMAHNVLAAIAFDLDALLQQQRLTVEGASLTWVRLIRQETVLLNQLRLLEDFVDEQRPRLPDSTHPWLLSYLDWMEQCRERLELAMESEDKLPLLQQTAKTLLRELEGRQRVDVTEGRLPVSIVNARKDFDTRSGTIFTPLQEMGGRANEVYSSLTKLSQTDDSKETLQLENTLATNAVELQVYRAAAVGQLEVRRSLTQARRDADPQYAVDAGLTKRAVDGLYRVHLEDPLAEPLLQQALTEVAPAYRILEAGHEVAQARDALDELLNLERWSSQGITSRLDHPRQWEALAMELGVAARRLREAGVDSEIAAGIDRLRYSPAARDAARKITSRRHRREAMVAAAYELAEMRTELNQIITELEPVMAEARAVIAKYVLSIAEMAQQAADDLRELEQETADAADQIEQPQPDQVSAEETLQQLQDEQEKINQQIEDLIDALIEDANQQDLLSEEELERARDDDAGIQLIQDAAAEMNQALQEAADAEDSEEQVGDLAAAAETQEKTADALEKIAEHFERMDAGEDTTETRAALRPEEQPAAQDNGEQQPNDGQQNPLDEQYAAAEDLARLANQNPQDLLRELEAELQNNPAMKEALSRISKDTLEQAKNSLEDAAQQDDALQRAIERSDPAFQAKKKELVEELKKLTQEAANVANTLVAQANSAAAQAKVPETQKQLAAVQQELENAQAKANQQNEEKLLSEIREAAEEIKQTINESAEQLAAATEQTAAAEGEQIHADEKARAAAQKNLENTRNKFNLERLKTEQVVAKRAADAERQANQRTQQAEKQLNNTEKQTQQMQQNVDKNPDNQGLVNALNQAKARQDNAQMKVDEAKQTQQAAQEVSDNAAEKVKQMAAAKPPLNKPNPAAELSNEFADEATELVKDLAKRAEELAQNTDLEIPLMPPVAQLDAAGDRQEDIQRDVEEAGQDVARAARHERRLENQEPVPELEAVAKAIGDVAANEIEQSLEQLAGAEANAQPQDGNDPMPPEPGSEPANGDATGASAREAIETSENAIAEQAAQLGEILDAAEAAAAAAAAEAEAAAGGEPMPTGENQPGQPGENQPGENQPGENQPGQPGENQPGQPGENQPGQPGENQPGQPGENQPGQPGEGAPSQAEMERGEMLARTLDELDQRLAIEAAGELGPLADTPLSPLAQAAQAQQASMAAARAPAMSSTPPLATALESLGDPTTTGELGRGFAVKSINRNDGSAWGLLRGKSAEDTAEGGREAVAAEYRQGVEAYFRVLAERARQKK